MFYLTPPCGWGCHERELANVNILDRYLAGSVIGGSLLTLGILVPLLGFFILFDEIDTIGREDYGLLQALLFMGLSLPRYAYQVSPIATLIGALVGLGVLASRSELVAMRAAGVSVAQIIRAAMIGGLALVIFSMSLGEFIAPVAEQRAVELRRQALAGGTSDLGKQGFWAVDGPAHVHIAEIRSATRLGDIRIYQVDWDTGTLETIHAATARYDGRGWVLEDIARSRAHTDGVQFERIPEMPWQSVLDPDILKVVAVDPNLLPVWGLYKYIRFMGLNKLDAGAYEVVFWSKMVHPLLMLSMIFIAIPILLSSARSTGLGSRVFIGVLLGILYYLVSRTFGFIALLFGLNALAAAIMPPLLFLMVAFYLLRRLS